MHLPPSPYNHLLDFSLNHFQGQSHHCPTPPRSTNPHAGDFLQLQPYILYMYQIVFMFIPLRTYFKAGLKVSLLARIH